MGSPAATQKRPPARERILIGAEQAFRKLGLGAARVEDILAAAGVSRRTFYELFSNKDEVAEALLAHSVAILVGAARSRTEGLRSQRARMAGALDVYFELWQRHGRVIRDLFAESMRPGSRLAVARRQAIDAVVQFVCADVEASRKRAIDPIVVEHLLLGVEGVLIHHMDERGLLGLDIKRLRASVGDLFERVLAAS